MARLCSTALLAVLAGCTAEKVGNGTKLFKTYVVDWAHYRAGDYKWGASDLAPIAKRIDVALFSFIYFCPPAGTQPMPYWAHYPYGQCDSSSEYTLMSVDPSDKQAIPAIIAMGPKLVFSVGGWNFPSAYWSKMVATAESRAKFVASVKSWMTKYNAVGVDLDWEFPCSPPRKNSVKITCTKFQSVDDAGGKCPDDSNNLVLLVKDLRAGLGPDAQITIASQAGDAHADQMNLKAVSQYISMWHIMSYDYAVSDVTGASVTSPNAPLFTPNGGVQMSINDTVVHYLNAGVPKEKIMVGVPLYAHTWYTPGLTGDDWKKFGISGTNQGDCCGPFQATMGAKPGQGCQLCGSMMYTEILKAQPDMFWDNQTKTTIGYMTKQGADGYTEAGTWLSIPDIKSLTAITKWAVDQDVAGVFAYSADMDTKDYKCHNAIADALGKAPGPAPGPGPSPGPGPGPGPSPGNCQVKAYQQCGGTHGCCAGKCTCSGSSSYMQCKPAAGTWKC